LFIEDYFPNIRIQIKHIMWSLFFLKNVTTEDVACSRWNVDRKTYRKWIWIYIDKMYFALKFLVSFENRYLHWNIKNPSFLVDCTECPILEPTISEWEYWSVKKGKHTVKYELGLSLGREQFIWVNGPFKGTVHDFRIWGIDLVHKLVDNERPLGDKGYFGSEKVISLFKPPKTHFEREFNRSHCVVRSQIERSIKRLKVFNIKTPF